MRNKAVCRPAPATPGLLMIELKYEQKNTRGFHKKKSFLTLKLFFPKLRRRQIEGKNINFFFGDYMRKHTYRIWIFLALQAPWKILMIGHKI